MRKFEVYRDWGIVRDDVDGKSSTVYCLSQICDILNALQKEKNVLTEELKWTKIEVQKLEDILYGEKS